MVLFVPTLVYGTSQVQVQVQVQAQTMAFEEQEHLKVQFLSVLPHQVNYLSQKPYAVCEEVQTNLHKGKHKVIQPVGNMNAVTVVRDCGQSQTLTSLQQQQGLQSTHAPTVYSITINDPHCN
jgi:hypothetical protein